MKNTSLTLKAAAVVSSVLLAGTYVAFRGGWLNFNSPRETSQPTPATTQAAPVGVNLNADGPLPLKPPNQNIPIETHGPREKPMFSSSKSAVMVSPYSTPPELEELDRNLKARKSPVTPNPKTIIYGSKSAPIDLQTTIKAGTLNLPSDKVLPPTIPDSNEPPKKLMLSGSKSFSVDLTPPPAQPATTPKPTEEEVRIMQSSSKSGLIDFIPPKLVLPAQPAQPPKAIMLGSKSAAIEFTPPEQTEPVKPAPQAQVDSEKQQKAQSQRAIMGGSKSKAIFEPNK